MKQLGPSTDLSAAQYLHHLMNDPMADVARRDRAAAVLLTYENRIAKAESKKQQIEREASTCDLGTQWEKLLRRDPPPPPSEPKGLQ